MRQIIYAFILSLVPTTSFAQLKANIDSITYSNRIYIQRDPDYKEIFLHEPLPLLIVYLSITNDSEDPITLMRSSNPSIELRYFYRFKPAYQGFYHYLKADWLNKQYEEYGNELFVKPLIIQPHQTIPLIVWTRPSKKEMEKDIDITQNPTSKEYSTEELEQWFKEILKNFKVVIYYGYETGTPKILLSDYFRKEHATVRIDLE